MTTSHEDDPGGKPRDLRLALRLLPFLASQVRLIAVSVALLFVVTGAGLVQPYLFKVLIDDHLLRGETRGLAGLVLLYMAAAAVELGARYGQIYLMERTGQNVILALRRRAFAHLQGLDAAYFDRHPVGRLMTRVTTDIESLADLFSSGVVTLLGDTVKLLAIVVILWWLDPHLATVTFAMAPVLFGISALFRGRIREAYREARRRIARINVRLQESISGMLIIQLFRREGMERREFEAINRDHRDAELHTVKYESSFSAFIELVGTLATAMILAYGGWRILAGVLTFGTLAAFLEYTTRFFAPIRDLSGFYAVLQAAMASLERVFELLDTRPTISSPAQASSPGPTGGRVEFDSVGFAYRPGVPVLRDVSFRIDPGERVAVVGATGAGKTTLVRLLIRLYDPDSGAVRIDGRDLRELPLPWIRRQVTTVLQDPFLVSGTIAGNIAFGNTALSRDRIEAAARRVHADEFIRRLPQGYDDTVRERGGNLSSGEKQLIGFARALACDPRILVLDEATSHVDVATEALIQEALGTLLRGRTALIIAHRLSTIIGADRILVMHHGRVVEEGTHGALVAQGGIYARLYALQFGTADGVVRPGPETDLEGLEPATDDDAGGAAGSAMGLPPDPDADPTPA